MEIILIRHGEPEWVRDGLSVVDPPLTDRGLLQAQRVGEELHAEAFDEVIVSPLRRARQTAAPLLGLQRRKEAIEPFLEEIREPNWHGTPEELAAAAYAEEKSRAAEDRWLGVRGGGEPPRDFVERVRAGGTDYFAGLGMHRAGQRLPVWHLDQPDLKIVIVAHSGTNGVLLCQLLGLDPVPWEWDRFVTHHASITRLQSFAMGDGHTFSLRRLSDVEHLPRDARTA
ncbi:MAG: histidine phosphatase family protein [Acidimicrobiaceae bacterium]|nr:histidine phosphatase family protein [Acidimicrobiaceae bacterium]